MKQNDIDLIEKYADEFGITFNQFLSVSSITLCVLMENQPVLKTVLLPQVKCVIDESLI
jgi:hypothetical protein